MSVAIECSSLDCFRLLEARIEKVFRTNHHLFDENGPSFDFAVTKSALSEFEVFKNEKFLVADNDIEKVLGFLESRIRLTIAEHAVGKIFVHAGVVSLNGIGIVIPGSSLSGKSTLVKEFVVRGAKYYSDEYAVFDENGLLHPFPKPISLREQDGSFEQTDYGIEEIGGVAATETASAGIVLFTAFEESQEWFPIQVSPGTGVLRMLEHAIPIRKQPHLTLSILETALQRSTIFDSKRGDAAETVKKVIESSVVLQDR